MPTVLWPKGVSGNPKGRPKGTASLKDFARKYLLSLTDEQKELFLKALPPEIAWKMAEGNPHNTDDITSKGDKIKSVVYLPAREKKE